MLNNYVEGFAGVAYRVIGDNSVVSGNFAANCFQVNENHMDGVQSWYDADGVITGLTVENNTIIEWNSPIINPLRCQLQGIGFFDGPYQDVVIRNNVISTAQYHGISVWGGINVQILNNTVVNNRGIEGTTPYIGIFNRKDGTPSQNILVANNLAMSILVEGANPSVTLVNDSTLMGLPTLFPNAAVFDYRPAPTSGFIDTGDATYAPPTDILGASRPYGAGPDRGAYEIGASSGTTSGTTTTGTTGGTTTSGTDGTTTGGTTTGGTTTTPPPAWSPKFLRPPKKK